MIIRKGFTQGRDYTERRLSGKRTIRRENYTKRRLYEEKTIWRGKKGDTEREDI